MVDRSSNAPTSEASTEMEIDAQMFNQGTSSVREQTWSPERGGAGIRSYRGPVVLAVMSNTSFFRF